MSELPNKLLAQLHILILLYAAYSVYTSYEEFEANYAAQEQQVPGIESDISNFKKRLKAIDQYKKNIENSRKSVEEVFKNIERVQKQLPAEVNDIDILDYIAKEGRGLNVPEIVGTPMKEQAEGFYVIKPYEIKARGTFLQLVVFMERLAGAERLYNVRKFKLSADEVPQKGRFQVISLLAEIETYKYNQSYKESSGLEEINSQFSEAGGAAGGGEKPRRRRRKESAGGGE